MTKRCLFALALFAGPTIGFAQSGGQRGGPPPPDPTKPHKLEITQGTRARYRVTEQLAGINFPNDAVGSTEAVTGAIVINPTDRSRTDRR